MNTIGTNDLVKNMREMAAVASGASGGVVNDNDDVSGKFSDILTSAIDTVNRMQQEASELKKAYELGDPNIDITQVMIASQKSEISFQALLQVRNKLLSAYQEVMRMQI